MNVKRMSVTKLLEAKEETEKQVRGLCEYLNSLDIKALIKDVSPIVETKPDTKLEQSDILDAIKRIATIPPR